MTRATAYVEQYSKFEQLPEYLDSAMAILQYEKKLRVKIQLLVQVYFIRSEYAKVVELVKEVGEKYLYDSLICRQSYTNRHAWSAYHLGEAYANTGDPERALKWYKRAVLLAPFNLEFRNKYGSALVSANDLQGGTREFEYIISENPKFVPAYSNLGYIKLLQGFHAEAKRLYLTGKELDPDNEQLLLNIAGYYIYMNDKRSATAQLNAIITKFPGNEQAKRVLRQLVK
jgi:Flp pilus assembly protein TadD